METPDYQYELLEEVAKAGWRAAHPNPIAGDDEAFHADITGWRAFMDAASMELRKRGWKIAIPAKAVD